MGDGSTVAPPPDVRVLAVSRVAPVRSPEEHAARRATVKLSFLDVQWITRSPVHQVFLYELPSAADAFPSAVRRLKDSLAAALALCLPLAGKLVYVEGTGDVVVDCSEPGVAFLGAEADGGGGAMNVRRLAVADALDVPAFLGLVPELDARVLPAPALSVQVTRLGGAGLALGVSFLRAVLDGRGFWRFVGLWTSACRGSTTVAKSPVTPSYSREAIAIAQPRSDELARELLKKVAPSFPVVSSSHDCERVRHIPPDRVAAVAGCPTSLQYEDGDFGFGRPALAECLPSDYDGRMMINSGRRDGDVQVSVSLDRSRMDSFSAHVAAVVGRRARL